MHGEMAKIRWGVLSTASIGRLVIEAARQAEQAEFVAVASRDADRARRFADQLGLEASFGSYEELLASDTVDAVYVPLPVSMHTEWTVRSLAAGKHVLCEKPFATSPQDVSRCFNAAESAGKLCAEGLMYRHHPQTVRARKLVSDGAIGRLTTVRAALSVSVDPGDIRRSVELGGGALLDLGCYCVSAVRLFAGQPARVYAEQVTDGAAGVDLRFAATMRTPSDVLGQFDIGLDLPRRDELELIGTNGKLTLPDPWLCRQGYLDLERGGQRERLPADPAGTFGLVGPDHDVYRIELDTISAAITGREPLSFGRTDAIGQATLLQALRRSSQQAVPIDLISDASAGRDEPWPAPRPRPAAPARRSGRT